jgi:ribosomal protein S18 acetylase RimI-like enzyme
MADNMPVRLEPSQVETAAAMLSRAFYNDPMIRHLYPNDKTRLAAFARGAQCALRYGLRYGECHLTSPRAEGTAVWLPPNQSEPSNWRMVRVGALSLVFTNGLGSFRRMMAYFDHAARMRRRRVSEPHWYLQLLGVDPEHHGKGLASLLLRTMFARTDRDQIPCCLDTENEVNVAMYRHFGFRVLESSVIPGTDRMVWLMLRKVGG